MQARYRIGSATLAIFAAIFGILVAIDGLLSDQESVLRYGAAAVVVSIAAFVLLLNPRTGIDDDAHADRRN